MKKTVEQLYFRVKPLTKTALYLSKVIAFANNNDKLITEHLEKQGLKSEWWMSSIYYTSGIIWVSKGGETIDIHVDGCMSIMLEDLNANIGLNTIVSTEPKMMPKPVIYVDNTDIYIKTAPHWGWSEAQHPNDVEYIKQTTEQWKS